MKSNHYCQKANYWGHEIEIICIINKVMAISGSSKVGHWSNGVFSKTKYLFRLQSLASLLSGSMLMGTNLTVSDLLQISLVSCEFLIESIHQSFYGSS